MNTPAHAYLDINTAMAVSEVPPASHCSHLTETDLSIRWGMSPKTLQRWRMEGLGPTYLKLGKRVVYSMQAILEYEGRILHISTSQRVNA